MTLDLIENIKPVTASFVSCQVNLRFIHSHLYRSSYHLTPASNRFLVYATLELEHTSFGINFEHAVRRLPLHHPVLIWALDAIVLKVAVLVCLYLMIHRLILGLSPLDTEEFIQQGEM